MATNITEVINLNQPISIVNLISSADVFAQLIMLVLAIASIWSWAIIINKLLFIRQVQKNIKKFESIFWSGKLLNEIYEQIKNAPNNPLAIVLIIAMEECKRLSKNIQKTDVHELLKMNHKDKLLKTMHITCEREIEKLEQNLGFLATVSSASPFIGLLGTVWGIMHSFQSIAALKNTTLAVVAPGIAEALLATVMGLFAAIPAVIFYNYLASKIMVVSNKIDDFIIELHNIICSAIDGQEDS